MGITHLGIHEGKTEQIRVQSAVPTDPDPEHKVGTDDTMETGDIYFDSDNEYLYIRNAANWVGIAMT
jgi:hypothetical protein